VFQVDDGAGLGEVEGHVGAVEAGVGATVEGMTRTSTLGRWPW